MMNRMPRAICTILNLSAAAAMNSEIFHRPRKTTDVSLDETEEEVSDPKLYEFEHKPVEGLRPLLKRSRDLSEEACKQTKETKGTDTDQEGTAKKRRVEFHVTKIKSEEEQRLTELVEKLESEYESALKMYNERARTTDENALEEKTQEIMLENPRLTDKRLTAKLSCTDEFKQKYENERKNNLSALDIVIIKVRNDFLEVLKDSYANLNKAKNDLEEYRKYKKKEKVKKAENDLREWINNLNCTPFDIADKDNSGLYLLDYKTMYFLATFLNAEPEFTNLFNDRDYKYEDQPFLWIFEWILQIDSISYNLMKEKIKMHSKSFTSYREIMAFVVEKIFEEDTRFAAVLSYKIELISRLEVQNLPESYASGVELPEHNNKNENAVAKGTDLNPLISFQSSFESKSLQNQNPSECFNKQRMVTLHELIGGYKDSKLTIQARRLEFSEEKSNENALQFQSIRMGILSNEFVRRKIRAIAFKSKDNEGKIMLNFITTEALKTYQKKEKDSILEKTTSCAVFVLYEDKDTARYSNAVEV
ncbi:hypothetical protein ENBRE01_2927 [Enteropsectra breve]|nr:hypothetical protein ENBRE01_2927 [Enteropsectra breve]